MSFQAAFFQQLSDDCSIALPAQDLLQAWFHQVLSSTSSARDLSMSFEAAFFHQLSDDWAVHTVPAIAAATWLSAAPVWNVQPGLQTYHVCWVGSRATTMYAPTASVTSPKV